MTDLQKFTLALGIVILAGCSQSPNIQDIKGTWKPVSAAYLTFGNMTIGDNAVAWSSGQRSPFQIIQQNKHDTVIELTEKDTPKFNGTVYKYIKLTPKDNIADLGKEDLRVTFIDNKNTVEGTYTRYYR